jgi:hypothetical protein
MFHLSVAVEGAARDPETNLMPLSRPAFSVSGADRVSFSDSGFTYNATMPGIKWLKTPNRCHLPAKNTLRWARPS